VLAIHDTTAIPFRSLPTQRFFAHVALMITDYETRHPLGIAGLGTWYRGASCGGGGWHHEYDRWWLMAQLASQRIAHQSVVHVMDREADDYRCLTS
jgi:hypothetical protein